MSHSLVRFAILATFHSLLITASACQKQTASQQPAPPQTEPKAAGAGTEPAESSCGHARGAKPGSHEDWCSAHKVPESLCTRCNGSLVPAFKATGDWCSEHGLPRSQCLACDPKIRIVRPPKTGEASS